MIKSENIGLRPIEESDLEFLCELANDPYVSTMVVGWGFPVSTIQQAQWIKNQYQNNSTLRLIVVDLISNQPIGLTGLWDIDWQNSSALSAAKFLPSKTQKGYGTEAVMLIMAYAFYSLGLRRIYSTILDFNGPSMSVFVRKCGWRIEGCQKEAVFRKGRWCDLYNIAILKSEFDLLPNIDTYIESIHPASVSNLIDISLFD